MIVFFFPLKNLLLVKLHQTAGSLLWDNMLVKQ